MQPFGLPPDLLLIQELVDQVPSCPSPPIKTVPTQSTDREDAQIASSDSEDNLEEQAVVKLIVDVDEESSPLSPGASSSDSDSSSEDEANIKSGDTSPLDLKDVEIDEEEENGVSIPAGSYFSTKNEVAEARITIPDIAHIPPEDELEKVGKIISIMGNTVIVEGLESESSNKGMERALDSETLLVFEDRQVFGYIYETFGPTRHPLYQVKFNAEYPLDPEKVRENRPVFHVPQRSRFVFLSQLKQLKGSDASNVNDEEPAADELEFSDDEAEAAHKLHLKRSRRAGSIAPSRTTPVPSQIRNDDNPYAGYDIYEVDHGGPSRPPPIPYDDPYAEPYLPYDNTDHAETTTDTPKGNESAAAIRPQRLNRGRGRTVRPDRPQRGRRGRQDRHAYSNRNQQGSISPSFEGPAQFGVAEPGMSIGARHYPQVGSYPQNSHGAWGQSQTTFTPPPPFQHPQQPVLPHINPRFASALGFGFWHQDGMQDPGYDTPQQHPPPGWTNEWGT